MLLFFFSDEGHLGSKPDPGDVVRARSETWPLASVGQFVLVLCLGEDELYQPQPGGSEGGRQS